MILFEVYLHLGRRLSNELLLNLDAKYTQFIATQSPKQDDLRYQFYKNIGIPYLKR